jgi:predicted dehydrogenase
VRGPADDSAASLGVGVIGFGWMGRVHAQAYARLMHHFPELPLRPALVSVADEVPGRAEQAAAQFGFGTALRDWRDLVADPGVQAARDLVLAGEIGAVTHVRIRLFSDYAAHPDGALTWRYERARGGNGVLGDLASHGVDLARYLLGEIEAMIADTDVDAVLIASSDATHPELAVAAVRAGKPVLCEKPLAPTLTQAAEVVRTVQQEGPGLLSLGFMRRSDPGYVDLKRR